MDLHYNTPDGGIMRGKRLFALLICIAELLIDDFAYIDVLCHIMSSENQLSVVQVLSLFSEKLYK
jgi:hypothetical protein